MGSIPRALLIARDPTISGFDSRHNGNLANVIWEDAATDAEAGWETFCRTLPDAVVLDMNLPGRPAVDLLTRIMRERPTPVIVISSPCADARERLVSGLFAGAISSFCYLERVGDAASNCVRLARIISLAATRTRQVMRAVQLRGRRSRGSGPHRKGGPLLPDKLLAIGAGESAIGALTDILLDLGRETPPVLVALNLPVGYVPHVAAQLCAVTGLDVRVAADGDQLSRGRILLAPDFGHLKISGYGAPFTCRIDTSGLLGVSRTSIDATFQSIAEVAGANAAGVLLGGLGVDGASGLLALRQTGAFTACEDPQTAIFADIPAASASHGSAEITAPVEEIADWILRAATERPLPAPPAPVWRKAAASLRRIPPSGLVTVIADEDPTTADGMRHALEEMGIGNVRTTPDIGGALAVAQKEECHLMILSWGLLRDDAGGVLQKVRDVAVNDETAVIVSVSDHPLAAGQAAIGLGAIGLLPRSPEPALLRRALERAILRSLHDERHCMAFGLAG
jgi:two-component system chemotaxis response regulator CheB